MKPNLNFLGIIDSFFSKLKCLNIANLYLVNNKDNPVSFEISYDVIKYYIRFQQGHRTTIHHSKIISSFSKALIEITFDVLL